MATPTIRAVVADPGVPERFVIRQVPAPQPLPSEALIRVKAVSINRGEVRRSLQATSPGRPGWDFSGVVEQIAQDGSGPKLGARVVGMLNAGSWTELLAAPTHAVAELPANVTFTQAATLPVAGLTALHALRKGGFLLGRPVLITGASGGVGDFACQLARLGGALPVAVLRSAERVAFVQSLGVERIVVGEDPSDAAKYGPYPLIVDSVGGPQLGKILAMLASGGTCVIFGATGGADPVINASRFYSTGRTTLYGFILFKELETEPASAGLNILAELVSAGKLIPHVELEESWHKVAEITQKLMDRKFSGKAVLQID